jgi:hypothetical protein
LPIECAFVIRRFRGVHAHLRKMCHFANYWRKTLHAIWRILQVWTNWRGLPKRPESSPLTGSACFNFKSLSETQGGREMNFHGLHHAVSFPDEGSSTRPERHEFDGNAFEAVNSVVLEPRYQFLEKIGCLLEDCRSFGAVVWHTANRLRPPLANR